MMKSWAQSAKRLVDVAAGRAPADVVLKGGIWVNVHSRECLNKHRLSIPAVSIWWPGFATGTCILRVAC